MHPRSGIQALYDAKGELVVKAEEYYVPPRRLWFSDVEKTNIVDEKLDYQRKVVSWAWGDQVSENYQYDEKGKLSNVIIAGYINQTYFRG